MICVVKMFVLVGGRNNFAQEKYKMQPDVKYYFQLFVTVKLTKLRTPKICLECLLWPIMISHPKIWQKIVFNSNKDIFTWLKLLFNHLKEKKFTCWLYKIDPMPVCTHDRGQDSSIQTDLARLIRCLLYDKNKNSSIRLRRLERVFLCCSVGETMKDI